MLKSELGSHLQFFFRIQSKGKLLIIYHGLICEINAILEVKHYYPAEKDWKKRYKRPSRGRSSIQAASFI